jgi:GNAT superfamily N-acetyltransferase
LTIEQFHQLPRDAAYKYEYFDNQAWLSPRPKQYHAILELRPVEVVPPIENGSKIGLRTLSANDWERLPPLFAGAFHRVQPFASLNDADREEAARSCLQKTRDGGDGPLIEPACFVAEDESDGNPVGVLLTTVMPEVDLTSPRSLNWKEPPPPDWLERTLGRPHLTWIFVSPWDSGHGIGSALLAAATARLLDHGYRELASTFLLGNDASLLWHWRNGFRLLAYPGSPREIHRRIRAERGPSPA